MEIILRLIATGLEPRRIKAQDGETARDVLETLGMDADACPFLLVNGRGAGERTALSDGDVVAVFPPVGRV